MPVLLFLFSFYLAVLLLITILNAVFTPMIRNGPAPAACPKVSLLVPARNEENNIGACLQSLTAQDYPDFEIWVLDDGSADQTAGIVQTWTKKDNRVQVMAGSPLPEGWTGKNWACHQLGEAARGNILIYTDADNTHAPDAVSKTVGWMEKLDLGLISAFPQQVTVTLAEKLVVPAFDNFVYSMLPMWLTCYTRHAALSAANGQWIAIRRDVYRRIGGHKSVRTELVEDVELARSAKRAGIRILTMTGRDAVFGRMYHSWREVREGFSKNAFGLTSFHTLPFFILLSLMAGAHVLPCILVFSEPWMIWSLAMLGGNVLLKTILALRYRQPFLTGVLLQPASVVAVLWIGFASWRACRKGYVAWKGRTVPFHKSAAGQP